MTSQISRPTAVVVGVGAELGLGAALCRKFAAEGYHVLAAGRTSERLARVVDAILREGGSAQAVQADATSETDVGALFERAFSTAREHAPADLVVFNAGNNQRLDFLSLDGETFEGFWRAGCYAGFLVGREAARRMVPLGRGTILFTGASASLRGRPGFAHFSVAKAGLRMLSQAMAREFAPQGIHVAHVVIDGGIDGEKFRSRYPEMVAQRGENGLLDPAAIAQTYWQLHCQPPSVWTQELDVRPFKETF